MFLLRENFFSVIISDKFCYYRTNLSPLHFWALNELCTINCYFCQMLFKSLVIMFNTSLSVSSLLISATPRMSRQFQREYCPWWSMLSWRTFDLSVKADSFSFNSFIILLFILTFFLIFIKRISDKLDWLSKISKRLFDCSVCCG